MNLVALWRARRSGSYAAWERDESSRRLGRAVVGVIVSRYPAISHTFVLREVSAMREAGLEVQTLSVRRADHAELFTIEEAAEASGTWAVRPVTAGAVAVAHLRLALRYPLTWVGGFALAIRRAPPGLRALVWQMLYFGEAVLVLEHCRRRGIRHLHAHLANVGADLAWLAADLGERVDGHGSWGWSFTMHGPTERAQVERYNLVDKVQAAKLVMCISEYARSQLMALTPVTDWPKLSVVHMGADLDRYEARGLERSVRTQLSTGGVVHLLCVGRLKRVKAQIVLVDAVVDLRRSGRQCTLTIVGEGPERGSLEQRVAALGLDAVVQLAGPRGQHELPEFYRQADIFCLPSLAEGVPVVLMEAMATELPVVSTRLAGIPELVDDGRSGILVAPGQLGQLVAAIASLVDDPAKRLELGRAGRRVVVQDFDARACGRLAAYHLLDAMGARSDRTTAGGAPQ